MTEGSNGMFNMPVVPAYGGNGGGFGFDGSSGWWILILLILFVWNGNNGWGAGNGAGGVGSEVQRGFDQNSVMTGLNGIQTGMNTGFGNVQNALCSGFAGVNAGIANGFAQAEISANARQMADMNQAFAMQSALQNCCCENRAATADLKYTIAQGNRDVIDNDNRNHQAVMDKLCQLEMDGYKQQLADANRTINGLQNQLLMAQNAASENAQTATIQAGQRALANEIEQYVLPTPRPAYIVQNPNCCQQMNFGCGCAA